MTRKLIGVAHRTLRCGTLIRMTYQGVSHKARVVDRGPFGVCWDWDATARLAIHLTGHPAHSMEHVRVRILR